MQARTLLALHILGEESLNDWLIDIGGDIDLYLTDYTNIWTTLRAMSYEERRARNLHDSMTSDGVDWLSEATPTLQSLVERMAEAGLVVDRAWAYKGLIPASHLLYKDELYQKVNLQPKAQQEHREPSRWPSVHDYIPRVFCEM